MIAKSIVYIQITAELKAYWLSCHPLNKHTHIYCILFPTAICSTVSELISFGPIIIIFSPSLQFHPI